MSSVSIVDYHAKMINSKCSPKKLCLSAIDLPMQEQKNLWGHGWQCENPLSCNWLVGLIHFTYFSPQPEHINWHVPKGKAFCMKWELILTFILKIREVSHQTQRSQSFKGQCELTGGQRLCLHCWLRTNTLGTAMARAPARGTFLLTQDCPRREEQALKGKYQHSSTTAASDVQL